MLVPAALLVVWWFVGVGTALAIPPGAELPPPKATPSGPAVNTNVNAGVTLTPTPKKQPVAPSSPKISIPIPDLKLRSPQMLKIGDNDYIDIPWIADYVAGAFRYGVGIGAVIAAVMIMIGGIQYLTAGGDTSRVMKGKEKISDAVLGLSILFGSFLILSTVNPDLVNLNSLRVMTIKRIEFRPEEEYDPGDSVGQTISGAACKTVAECEQLCFTTPPVKADAKKGIKYMPGVPKDPKTWPTANNKTISPSQVKDIPAMPGITPIPGVKGTQAMIDYLKQAGIDAQKLDPSYSIVVGSVYRPLLMQITLVCRQFEKFAKDPCQPDADGMCKAPNKPKRGSDHPKNVLGNGIAWPGQSNHGSGKAADVRLFQGDTQLTCAGLECDQQKVAANAAILRSIMEGAGGKMLSIEIWHYDIK